MLQIKTHLTKSFRKKVGQILKQGQAAEEIQRVFNLKLMEDIKNERLNLVCPWDDAMVASYCSV